MKILHTVQRYFPESGGSEEVVRQISEHLVRWGHEVTVATRVCPERTSRTINGVRIAEFDLGGNSADGIRGDSRPLVDFVRTSDFDVIMNYAAQIWSTDLFFPLLPELRAKMVLVPCGYSALRNPRFAGYFRSMPDILRRYDAVVYLSPNYIDAKFGKDHGLTNGVVIPNGADPREFDPALTGRFRARYGVGSRPVMLNVSNHSTLKNHRFFWTCARSLADLNVLPVLIGSAYFPSPKKWLKECYAECRWHGAAHHGLVLEDLPRSGVAEAYVDADVFVFGSRVECSPLVMFEAFASRTLFVATESGNITDHADIACVVQDEREAVDLIRRYLRSPEMFRERIERGYDAVQRELNWEQIARNYLSLYSTLSGRPMP